MSRKKKSNPKPLKKRSLNEGARGLGESKKEKDIEFLLNQKGTGIGHRRRAPYDDVRLALRNRGQGKRNRHQNTGVIEMPFGAADTFDTKEIKTATRAKHKPLPEHPISREREGFENKASMRKKAFEASKVSKETKKPAKSTLKSTPSKKKIMPKKKKKKLMMRFELDSFKEEKGKPSFEPIRAKSKDQSKPHRGFGREVRWK